MLCLKLVVVAMFIHDKAENNFGLSEIQPRTKYEFKNKIYNRHKMIIIH